MISILWHSGKGETIERAKEHWLAMVWGEVGRLNRWNMGYCRTLKLFVVIFYCRLHDIMHLWKPEELYSTKMKQRMQNFKIGGMGIQGWSAGTQKNLCYLHRKQLHQRGWRKRCSSKSRWKWVESVRLK